MVSGEFLPNGTSGVSDISGDYPVTHTETSPRAQRKLAADTLEALRKKISRDEASPEDMKLFADLNALRVDQGY